MYCCWSQHNADVGSLPSRVCTCLPPVQTHLVTCASRKRIASCCRKFGRRCFGLRGQQPLVRLCIQLNSVWQASTKHGYLTQAKCAFRSTNPKHAKLYLMHFATVFIGSSKWSAAPPIACFWEAEINVRRLERSASDQVLFVKRQYVKLPCVPSVLRGFEKCRISP